MTITMTTVAVPVVSPTRTQDQSTAANAADKEETSGTPAANQPSQEAEATPSSQATATESPQSMPVAPVTAPSASAQTSPSRPSAQSVLDAQTSAIAQDALAVVDSGIISDGDARAMADAYRLKARERAVIDALSDIPDITTLGLPHGGTKARALAGSPYAAGDAVSEKAPLLGRSTIQAMDMAV